MHKIFLIIRREYLTRVRKKSFIVMTILAPVLVVAFYGIIFYFTLNKDIGESKKKFYISDNSGLLTAKLQQNKMYEFVYGNVTEPEAEKLLNEEDYFAVILIPGTFKDDLKGIKFLSKEQPGFGTVNYIENQIAEEIKNQKLESNHIDPKVIEEINDTRINVETIKITSSGMEKGDSGASTAIGFISAFLIYMFIFLYGVQIMQGVIEEKTNRIVEVLISSVKPFELMMGKIIGIALVGLTQFLMWIALISILGGSLSGVIMSNLHMSPEVVQSMQSGSIQPDNNLGSMLSVLPNYNYFFIIGMFLFYFLGGYLFYGALFAAIGSAIDNETDKQQFMFPVTLPLIFGFVMAQSAVTSNPNSTLSFWLSVIPFTSSMAMMVRIPFGVPVWQIIVSMLSLTGGFIFTVWIAGRIYRIGILMYGKKPSYKEIGKWLFYKN